MKPIEVKLQDGEIKLGIAIGDMRSKVEQESGKESIHRVMKDKMVKNNRIGAIGEIAFCKHFNLYPDLGEQIKAEDCIYMGKTVDVKTTDHPNGSLLVPEYKEQDYLKCDAYVLVTLIDSTAYIHGWASDKRVAVAPLVDHGYGKLCHTLKQHELRPFQEQKVLT